MFRIELTSQNITCVYAYLRLAWNLSFETRHAGEDDTERTKLSHSADKDDNEDGGEELPMTRGTTTAV